MMTFPVYVSHLTEGIEMYTTIIPLFCFVLKQYSCIFVMTRRRERESNTFFFVENEYTNNCL